MAGKSIAAAAAFAAAACLAPAAIVFDAPGHVAVEGISVAASGGEPGAAWTLLDWRGRDTGIAGAFNENGAAILPPLPSGYYSLNPLVTRHSSLVTGEAGRASLAFLAVVPNPNVLPPDPATPIGVDACASWFSSGFLCPWNDGEKARTVADLIRLAGVAHVRERLSWRGVQKKPDAAPVWGHYTNVTALFAMRGIGVSQMFHDAPTWTGAIPRKPGSGLALPRDLGALWRFCHEAAIGFGDTVEDWEFWNEEDIHFAPEPAWDYAAALKVAYLGFKAARPDKPVVLGGLAGIPNSTSYEATLLANDAAKFFDVFNWHTYGSHLAYRRHIAAIRENLARAGVGDRAIWVTEFGTNSEGHSNTEGAIKGKGFMAHSPAQELVHAEFYPKAEIALRASGVARDYFFVFCPVNERGGHKDWGVMRRDGTVKPVYAAIATLNREVGSARLLGTIDAGAGICAWLFERPDGSQTVAFWSESPLDKGAGGVVKPEPDFAREWVLRPAESSAVQNPFRLSDMCGAISLIAATNGVLALPATRFPSYVSGLRGLGADRPAVPPGRVLPYAPAPDENLSVVIRADLNRDDFEIGDAKTLAILKGETGRMRIQVWNFGDAAATGVVEAAGAHVEGLPAEPFAVGPRGAGPVEFDIAVSSGGTGPDREALALSGVFDGKRTSRLAIPIFHERRFEAGAVREPLAWDDPALWRRNDSAQTYRISRDEAEGGAIRFDVAWTEDGTDRWFYPVRGLDLPGESLAGAKAIEFEVKTAQDKVENNFRHSLAMLVYRDGRADRNISYLPPTRDWERRRLTIPGNADPASVKAIRVGGNPAGRSLTFWIRNLSILKSRNDTGRQQ